MVLKKDSGNEFIIERPEKFGGNIAFKSYDEIAKAYSAGDLHPMDLKQALAKEIDLMLEPIRKDMKGKEKLINEAYP